MAEVERALRRLSRVPEGVLRRGLSRIGLVAQREAKAYAPRSPTMKQISATLKRKRRTAQRAYPGNLEKSVAFEVDATAAAIRSALSRVRSFASGVGQQLANVKAGFDMVAGAVSTFARAFAAAIGESFRFEKAVANFKTLLGSVDAAKEHIAELKAFASATPLTFDDLAGASKLILSFGGDVDKVMPNLKMLGDIAMGDSQKFKGLALVFAQVQSCGKLMGQDLLQMINQGFNPLTVIAQQTGKSMAELKDMVSEGSISFEMVAEAMRVATSEGGLFCGAMDEASKTGEGMVSTLKDKWSDAVRTFGDAFGDVAKNGLQRLIDKIAELTENGTVAVWAQNAVDAIGDVASACRTAAEWIGKIAGPVWKTVRGHYDSIGNAVGGFAGTLAGGGGLTDALKAAGSGYKQGWVDAFDTDGAEARDRAARRSAASARLKAKREAEAAAQGAGVAAGSAGSSDTLSQMMERIDARRAEKEAQKKEEAAKKAAAAEAKRKEQLRREEERARLAVERRIPAETERAKSCRRRADRTRAAENAERLERIVAAAAANSGLSYLDMMAQTPSRLNAMVLAAQVEAGARLRPATARMMVDYTATLNEIRARLEAGRRDCTRESAQGGRAE